ncbi:MAG TPA: isoamylase early set domain-containing protein, partial [Rectinemataceae bacterium]
ALSNAVMETIYRPESRLKPFAAAGHRTRRSRRIYPALAAAAALVFFLGIGFGIYFSRYGSPGSGMVTVRFSIEAPQASKVALAGDFTGWSDEEYELRRVGKTGTWEIRIPLERGKAYVYNFVIDGSTWVPDPAVPAKIADGFGGSGSLLRL